MGLPDVGESAEPPERRAQRVLAVELVGSVRDEHEDLHAPDTLGQISEKFQRSQVRPVHVFDCDDDRLPDAEAAERIDDRTVLRTAIADTRRRDCTAVIELGDESRQRAAQLSALAEDTRIAFVQLVDHVGERTQR